MTVARWYSQIERRIDVVSQMAVWYHSEMPPVPVRWVLIRDPQDRFKPQALLCTDLTVEPLQVVS